MDLYLEILAVLFGLGYLFFLMKEQIICWFFGIISSLFSMVLFYRTGLYSESILYIYYVIIGVYGFVYWNTSLKKKDVFHISSLPKINYLYIIIIGEILALMLGYIFDTYTNAEAPYLDSNTTVFSFIASYLEVKKNIASWEFWIVINAVTIILYFIKDLKIYTALTVIYLVFSFIGYAKWKRKMKLDL